MEGNYLITTDNYFFGSDGQQYKAVWGKVKIMKDEILGVKTNRASTNWYAMVGDEEHGVLIAGCQIHYAVKCKIKPNTQSYIHEEFHEGKLIEHEVITRIYLGQYE